MRFILIISLFISYVSNSQIITDTTLYIGVNGDTVKVVNFKNAATSPIATTTRLGDTAAVLRGLLDGKQNTIGFTPYNATNPDGFISGITGGNVTTALGFTPYNATNPSGYISAVPAQTFASLTGKPTTLLGYGITDAYPLSGNPSSFLVAADIAGKQNTISLGTTLQYFRGDLSLATFPTTTAAFTNSTNKNFVTDAQATVIGNTSGINSGDNATNTQYSGLAASKQDVLVSATNIKTVNGSTILGSGDLVVSGGAATSTSGVGASPTASSTTTVTHNLGRVPSVIRIYGYGSFTSNAAATATTSSIGVFSSSGNFCVYQRYGAAITTTQAGLSSNAFAILLATGGGNFISGVIQNVTSTQFDIAWSETGAATAQPYLWEAQQP